MQKLLLVDRSPVLRSIQVRVLREAEMGVGTILEAASAEEALAQLDAHPDVGTILCDARIAAERGLVDAVRRRRTAQWPSIVLLAAWDSCASEAAREQGADGWLRRPYTPDAVRALLVPEAEA